MLIGVAEKMIPVFRRALFACLLFGWACASAESPINRPHYEDANVLVVNEGQGYLVDCTDCIVKLERRGRTGELEAEATLFKEEFKQSTVPSYFVIQTNDEFLSSGRKLVSEIQINCNAVPINYRVEIEEFSNSKMSRLGFFELANGIYLTDCSGDRNGLLTWIGINHLFNSEDWGTD